VDDQTENHSFKYLVVQWNEMSILKNAIDSIAMGLEDYESPDNRRIISSTRNIFAGILLLFKHKLSELSSPESDEALIKQSVLPEKDGSGDIRWIGKGKKTVDVQTIKDRFQSLKIDVDWNRLDKINNYRNDVEHYYSNLNHESIQQLISDSFIIIRDFISEHLDDDPKDLLGDKSWSVLVEVHEVYEREKAVCTAKIEDLQFYSDEICMAFVAHKCKKCGSGLISPYLNSENAIDQEFECRSCDENYTYDEIVKEAIPEYYEAAIYSSHKDGGEIPLIDCPSCFEGLYIYSEQICAGCGYRAEHECQRCGLTIPPEEITEDSVCGWCAHMMAKDD
jgi:hypothetical protein